MTTKKEKEVKHHVPLYKQTTGILFIRGLPVNTVRMFKAYCARRGITMNAKFHLLINECINEDILRAENPVTLKEMQKRERVKLFTGPSGIIKAGGVRRKKKPKRKPKSGNNRRSSRDRD